MADVAGKQYCCNSYDCKEKLEFVTVQCIPEPACKQQKMNGKVYREQNDKYRNYHIYCHTVVGTYTGVHI